MDNSISLPRPSDTSTEYLTDVLMGRIIPENPAAETAAARAALREKMAGPVTRACMAKVRTDSMRRRAAMEEIISDVLTELCLPVPREEGDSASQSFSGRGPLLPKWRAEGTLEGFLICTVTFRYLHWLKKESREVLMSPGRSEPDDRSGPGFSAEEVPDEENAWKPENDPDFQRLLGRCVVLAVNELKRARHHERALAMWRLLLLSGGRLEQQSVAVIVGINPGHAARTLGELAREIFRRAAAKLQEHDPCLEITPADVRGYLARVTEHLQWQGGVPEDLQLRN